MTVTFWSRCTNSGLTISATRIGIPARIGRRSCMPSVRSREAASPVTSAFGRRSTATSEDFRRSARSMSRVSTATSTVSIALPVKRSLVGAGLLSLLISKAMSKRPLRAS
ncbi:hypothetical protein ACVWWR_008530 [Bradyrhizobium sp. LM3.2]